MTPDERTCPSKKNEPLRYLCQKKIKLFDGINRLLDIPTPLHIPKVLHAQKRVQGCAKWRYISSTCSATPKLLNATAKGFLPLEEAKRSLELPPPPSNSFWNRAHLVYCFEKNRLYDIGAIWKGGGELKY